MHRLDKRCKEMREIKKSLIKEIDEEMIRKFGAIVDVDLLEETVLNNMFKQTRRSYQVDVLRGEYDVQIADLKVTVYLLF